MNVRLDCPVTNAPSVNMRWSFNKTILPNRSIGGMGECTNTSGMFQLRHQPHVLIICGLEYSLHNGWYKCLTQKEYGVESRPVLLGMIQLSILGKMIGTIGVNAKLQ